MAQKGAKTYNVYLHDFNKISILIIKFCAHEVSRLTLICLFFYLLFSTLSLVRLRNIRKRNNTYYLLLNYMNRKNNYNRKLIKRH